MTDIVATETAKAQEQAARLFANRGDIDDDGLIVTALLEAKADVLAEVAYAGYEFPEERDLRQEVLNRRQKGL